MLAALTGCGANLNNGNGEKVGQVVKITKHGLFWKTWEAEMIRGGMSNGSGAFGTTPFDFTIEDDATAERVRLLMESQTEIVLHYRTEGIYWLKRSDSEGQFLNSIEAIKPK